MDEFLVFVIIGATLFAGLLGFSIGKSTVRTNLTEMCKNSEDMIIKRDFADLKISCEVVKCVGRCGY